MFCRSQFSIENPPCLGAREPETGHPCLSAKVECAIAVETTCPLSAPTRRHRSRHKMEPVVDEYAVPPRPPPTNFPLSSPRGASLAKRVWAPAGPPRALLLIVHGGGWHSGYFAQLATHLAANSIFCAAFDQAGCGYSDPEPSAPEGCAHFDSYDDLVDDVFAAVEWAQLEAGGSAPPLYLLGESFGGLHVLASAMQAEQRGVSVAGVVTLGALVRIPPALLPPRPFVSLCVFAASYFPRVRLPAVDLSATYDQAFGDPEWAGVARGDPVVQISPRPTLSGLKCTLATGEELLAKAAEFPVPLLAIHAERDCRADLSAVEEFTDRAGPTATLVVIDSGGHQLLQDVTSIRNDVIQRISNWITASLA